MTGLPNAHKKIMAESGNAGCGGRLTVAGRSLTVTGRSNRHARVTQQRGLSDLNILILLGMIFLIPVVITAWFLVQKQHSDIVLAERAMAGSQYYGALREVARSVAAYRTTGATARDGLARQSADVNIAPQLGEGIAQFLHRRGWMEE